MTAGAPNYVDPMPRPEEPYRDRPWEFYASRGSRLRGVASSIRARRPAFWFSVFCAAALATLVAVVARSHVRTRSVRATTR